MYKGHNFIHYKVIKFEIKEGSFHVRCISKKKKLKLGKYSPGFKVGNHVGLSRNMPRAFQRSRKILKSSSHHSGTSKHV